MEKKIRDLVLKSKKMDISYADIRFIEEESEIIALKNLQIDKVSGGMNGGVGIRVLKDGAWGFYATNDLDEESLHNCLLKAYDIASCGSKVSEEKVSFEKIPPQTGNYKTKYEIDPFSISKEDKIKLLMECMKNIVAVEGIKIAKGDLISIKENS